MQFGNNSIFKPVLVSVGGMRLHRFLIGSGTTILPTVTLEPLMGSRRKTTYVGAGMLVFENLYTNTGIVAQSATWEKQRKPFVISITSIEKTPEERVRELAEIAAIINEQKTSLKNCVGIQIVFATSTKETDDDDLQKEILESLGAVSSLELPCIVKVSIHTSPSTIATVSQDPNCGAIAITSPIAWNDIAEDARKIFFRRVRSPFTTEGGGYVIGKYFIPLVAEWIMQARKAGAVKSIIAGGGISRKKDIDTLRQAGAHGIFLDETSTMRPWNIRSILSRAYEVFT